MTYGFITTLRGIEINVTKTLNKHYKKHKKITQEPISKII